MEQDACGGGSTKSSSASGSSQCELGNELGNNPTPVRAARVEQDVTPA